MLSTHKLQIEVFDSLNYFQINEFIKIYGVYAFPCEETISNEEYFIMIETAVRFKLTNNQKLFILKKDNTIKMSSNEKLSACCIILALSEGSAIETYRRHISVLDLHLRALDIMRYGYTKNYMHENARFFSIWRKLKKYGFNVRGTSD